MTARLTGPAALVVLDVDQMTRFNDARGCLAGDEALAAIEQTLTSVAAPVGATVRRAGGDGFELLVAGADGVSLAEAARAAVAAQRIALAPTHDPDAVLTVSAGAALVEPGDAAPAVLVAAAAHAALQRAKRWGRNRVTREVVSGRDDAPAALPRVGPYALVVARVEHMQAYNDRYGRGAGDALLERIGDALARCADGLALPPPRRTGDTFALVLREAAGVSGDALARALAATLARLAEPHGHPGAGSTVTASVGVAEVPAGARPERARVLEAAQQALAQCRAQPSAEVGRVQVPAGPVG